MFIFIELWNTKPTWDALPPGEQQAFVKKLIKGIEDLDGPGGIEMLGWGAQFPGLDFPLPYKLFAIWRVPSEPDLARVQAALRAANWYDYVDQVNVAGQLLPSPTAVPKYLLKSSS